LKGVEKMFKRCNPITCVRIKMLENEMRISLAIRDKIIDDLKEKLKQKSTDRDSLINNVVDYGQRKVTFELPKVDENKYEGVIFRYNDNVYAVVMKNGEAIEIKEI
jgi:hypothetical protein